MIHQTQVLFKNDKSRRSYKNLIRFTIVLDFVFNNRREFWKKSRFINYSVELTYLFAKLRIDFKFH